MLEEVLIKVRFPSQDDGILAISLDNCCLGVCMLCCVRACVCVGRMCTCFHYQNRVLLAPAPTIRAPASLLALLLLLLHPLLLLIRLLLLLPLPAPPASLRLLRLPLFQPLLLLLPPPEHNQVVTQVRHALEEVKVRFPAPVRSSLPSNKKHRK